MNEGLQGNQFPSGNVINSSSGFERELIEELSVSYIEFDGTEKEAVVVNGNMEKCKSEGAFAYYCRGLVLTRLGRGERALVSFKEALVAELRRDVPDGFNLRLFRNKIREAEETLTFL